MVGIAPSAAPPAWMYWRACSEPARSRPHSRRRSARQVLAQPGDLLGKLQRAAGSLAAPERDAGRGALGVFHPQRPGFHAADAPGGGAEQEDIAGHALHGEILVHRAHCDAFGLGHHQVLRGVGNGAARGDGGEARVAPAAHAAVHGVAVQVGAGAAARRGDALGEHSQHLVEIGAGQRAVGPGAAHEFE